jgi:predicted acylesterase/phospholipase RssA
MAMTTTETRTAPGFRLLSLDGGGMKGIFAAAILACLEDDLGISVVDRFDLVAGTSTGGIIALGLGAGLRPREILDFYVSHGPAIFPRPRVRALRRLLRSKHRARPLRIALEEVLGERTLANSDVALAIPSYDLCNDDVHLFRTPHAPHLRRDGRELMVDVGLATTAAPTYLPAHPLRGLRLVDGGMWANNPTLVGIVEAVSTFGCQLADIRVFSLGTTLDTGTRPDRLDHGGLLPWASDAIDVVLRGQTITADNHAHLLLGKERMLRVDPSVAAGELSLDHLSVERLLGRAERWSRHIGQAFKQRFIDDLHTSQTTKPLEGACSTLQPT